MEIKTSEILDESPKKSIYISEHNASAENCTCGHFLDEPERFWNYASERHFDDVQMRIDIEVLHKSYYFECDDKFMNLVLDKLKCARDNTTIADMDEYIEYNPKTARPVFNHFIAIDSHGEDFSSYYGYVLNGYYRLIGGSWVNM